MMKAASALEASKYFLSFLGPAVLIWGWETGGLLGRFGTLIFYEGFVPVCDLLLGCAETGDRVARKYQASHEQNGPWFRLPLFLWAATQMLMIGWSSWRARDLSWLEVLWLGYATGLVTSVTIAVAHELLHKLNRFDRCVAALLLDSVLFGHYRIAHTEHHRRVATKEDFATARINETSYEFLPRALVGGLSYSFRSERQRLIQQNKNWISLQNEFVTQWGISFAIMQILLFFFGVRGLAVFILQGLTAVTIHEMTSYIEHYGLRRKLLENGKYEKVGLEHSWVAPQRLTNFLTFNVQIHPDHHVHALTSYENLVVTQSPVLPAGYPAMMVLAYCPPLWKYFIHKRLPESVLAGKDS